MKFFFEKKKSENFTNEVLGIKIGLAPLKQKIFKKL